MNAPIDATSIVTRAAIPASSAEVWRSLMFYEQIKERPPLLLLLLLPRPLGTRGSKASVGDQATCLYDRGHLIKQATRIDEGHLYAFSVVEQHLPLGGGITLNGGRYALRALPAGGTELEVTTHYLSRQRPRWLAQPIEAFVCHMFHRHLLSAIRRKAVASVVTAQPRALPDQAGR